MSVVAREPVPATQGNDAGVAVTSRGSVKCSVIGAFCKASIFAFPPGNFLPSWAAADRARVHYYGCSAGWKT